MHVYNSGPVRRSVHSGAYHPMAFIDDVCNNILGSCELSE